MSKIVDLLNAISNDLKSANLGIPDKNIEITPGTFDSDDLERQSFRAPALRIAFLGAPKTEPLADETRRYEASFAVFVVTDGRDRVTDGLGFMEVIAARIEANRFSDGLGVGIPKNQRMQTIYTSPLKNKAVSINAVAWTQIIRIGEPDSIAGPTVLSVIPEGGTNPEQHYSDLPKDAS